MIIPETYFSVHEELVLFGLSCIFGAVIGVFWDIFRAFRLIFPHNFLLTAIEDFIFLAAYVIFIVSFTSVFARGQMRFYYILGNAIGFFIYIATAGNFIINTLKKLILIIFKPLKSAYVFLCKKAGSKFVKNSKLSENNKKNFNFLLLKQSDLVYNKKENKKRKNVKFIAEKSKRKAE